MTWSETDRKNLSSLCNISKMIYELYKKIYNFDINLEEGELKKHLGYLQMFFDMEDEVFEKWDLNPSKTEFLLELTHLEEKLDFNDIQGMILSRIHERLKKHYYNNLYFKKLNSEKDMDEKQIISSVIYSYNVNSEFEYLVLEYLKEERKQIKSVALNEYLASSQYVLLFDHINFQENIVNGMSENSLFVFLTTPFLSDILNISQNGYDNIEEMFISISENTLEFLDRYSDDDFSDERSLSEIIYLKCNFRAAIYYLNDKIISELDELLDNLKSSNIKFMLKDVIRNTKQDHTKNYALSLKPNYKP